MRFNPFFLSSAAAVALTCAVSVAALYYKSRKTEINEVMVFCKLQYNVYNYFDKLLSFIDSASKSVNVCMPSIHNPAIQGRLVRLIKKKNIKIRIIIDRTGYNESTEVFLKELIDAGAEIKCKLNEPNHFKMQHKFCLVDDQILMTGTLNWGNDRSFDHWNYVYITSKQQLVYPVKSEFYLMWHDFTSDLQLDVDVLSNTSDVDSSEDDIEFVTRNDNDPTEILSALTVTAEDSVRVTPELIV
ncbi:hypothetical protein MSG28_005252 [Choristoneura fumiferana]|uniref:Uncharacterized protein n=1 Tax=Choristoneura fumiferana TaxID=7141 RepID=A0ACC0JQI5_CHOFU|nr:hypothetical protein MSG28_005252 [Choristoneura fumiferana]